MRERVSKSHSWISLPVAMAIFVSALFAELPKDDRSFDLTYNSGNSVIRAIYAPNEDKILGVESKRLVEWKVGSNNQYIELTDWISKEKVFSDAIYAFDSDEKIYSCYINPIRTCTLIF